MTLADSSGSLLLSLRAQLKEWEKSFSDAHGGRKATRDDIKQDLSIAAKYKEYSRLRCSANRASHVAVLFGDPIQGHVQRKRPYPFATTTDLAGGDISTPQKVTKFTNSFQSTEIHKHHPCQLDPYESPSNARNLSGRTHPNVAPVLFRSAIAPTPQRDGKVLGLFDLLSPLGGGITTPSSQRKTHASVYEARTPSSYVNGFMTPRRSDVRARRHSLTPASSAKKFYFSKFFATPRMESCCEAQEANEDQDAENNLNPSCSLRKTEGSEFETPSFLRRRNVLFPKRIDQDNKNARDMSPTSVRMPQRLVGKGLSQLVQSLRELEEESMKDDMEALRAVEALEGGTELAHVEDGHPIDTYTNDVDMSSSPSKTRTPWKRRGQKRATKLVYLRPVRGKSPSASLPVKDSEDEPAPNVGSQVPNLTRAKSKDTKCKHEAPGENKLVQRVQKIKEVAHANYRALKIRSKSRKDQGRFKRRR
ncbi:hypothetical protein LOZ61_004695 [Ophidiomyces ophidiicola]|nr:hypothetical protein LOZ64_006094 [Ophidiomyces ophidiicola]KAI1909969.1 hypothetical protein LOZ61_004695 [Ophidiomyces ophidiicola]KAI1925974.1 hypothetical protein LOZ60_003786 [Ophidiomyces ophidiicola]KAI1962287.1 hypothetical protein LOZ59_002117 [Ophidiomyces ophidiicola]KAI2001417.1 hypothetical protein LOZ49_006642 [Ophidiomyces ophidiicola]